MSHSDPDPNHRVLRDGRYFDPNDSNQMRVYHILNTGGDGDVIGDQCDVHSDDEQSREMCDRCLAANRASFGVQIECEGRPCSRCLRKMEEMRYTHADGKWKGVNLRWCHFRTGPNQSTYYRMEVKEGPKDGDDMNVDDGDGDDDEVDL
jgi:hypothetical protein